MIEATLNLFGIGFVIAQGGVIFLTAWLARRYLSLASNWWKPLLMLLSYFAWIFATSIGYSLLGGEWGLIDGGLFMLTLFTSAAHSSLIYLFGWLLVSRMDSKLNG